MKWTQRHSRNAVAAKARKRMAAADFSREIQQHRMRHRRAKVKWRLQIRDLEHGDSITLKLYRLPWPARYVDGAGREYSAATLGRFITALLTHAA